MKPRMHFDDIAWEKSENVGDSWLNTLYDPETYNSAGVFLAEHHHPRQWSDFKFYKIGGFNLSSLKKYVDIKLQENETRPLLWDLGHYNLEYICKMND